MRNSTLGATIIIKNPPALVMSELPDTDIWRGEQRRKKTERAKQIRRDAYEQNTGAKCHKLTLSVCTEIRPLQAKFL